MLVMSLLLLLLSLQGTGWLLPAMADPPIGRTAENRIPAAKTIKRIVRLLYKLLRDVIKEVLIKAALIIVRLCHRWVRTSWVDTSADHAADIVYHLSLNLWQGRTKICVETTKCICAGIINPLINIYCITLRLCSISWTKLWWDPELACFPDQQTMVDRYCGEGNEYRVDFTNQWSIFNSHLLHAIEVCPVNKIQNFSRCKSKLALLNLSSRQWLNKKGTSNLLHESLWGM